MIVEAATKQVAVDKHKFRIDVLNPRFRFRPLTSISSKYANKKIVFFTEWGDLDTSKCMTVNGSKLAKDKVGGNLIRGMVVCCGESCDCCEGSDTVYIHMPEQLIK